MSTTPHPHPALAALAGMVLALAGCAGPVLSEAGWDRQTTRLLQARKAASQAVVDGDRIAGAPAGQYVNHRTALLLGGDGRITTQTAPNGRSAVVAWTLQPGGEAGGVSSAAALTTDGYFLTAAHAVGDARLRVVRSTGRGVEVARVRVVWKGELGKGGPDLALIHAPARVRRFSDGGRGRASVAVPRLTAGFGDIRQNQSRGRLRKVGAWQRDAHGVPWRLLEHTAPLMRGDSGGPLVDHEGRLLGVNTEFLVQPASLFGIHHLRVYRPMAVAADTRWLNLLITNDRARNARSAPG